MGSVLTIEGVFPDADTEAAYVSAVVDLVAEFTADLVTAKLTTDFNGEPALPVGEVLPPLTINGSLPPATLGAMFSANLSASGGVSPYTWAANGLPDGLNIDPNTGTITGTPTAGGEATISVTVTDSAIPSPDQFTAVLPLIVGGPVSDEDKTQDDEIKDINSRLDALSGAVQSILDKLNETSPATATLGSPGLLPVDTFSIKGVTNA